MPASELVMEGVNLMLLGMGIVFTFLILLIFVLNGMSKIAGMLEKPEEHPVSQGQAVTSVKPAASEEQELIAVISAAINKYRSKR